MNKQNKNANKELENVKRNWWELLKHENRISEMKSSPQGHKGRFQQDEAWIGKRREDNGNYHIWEKKSEGKWTEPNGTVIYHKVN